ncbi:MAG: 4-(cytidine 5'-diphospho)-2-C-methyl-D-erythritol kinase [Nitrospirota bacterium]
MNELVLRTPAKINLCLSVLGKRPDGYHEVEMVMQAVGLYDKVKVKLAESGIMVSCDDAAIPAGPGNIAYRAAREMLDLSGSPSGMAIEIKKNIPVAAGLGGGSSDAAAVLVACNRLLGTDLKREQLAEIGTRLGMDVPFFLFGPTALAKGRGELLTALPPPPKFWVLLVNPGFETSTAWVYKNLNFGLTKKGDCTNIAGLKVSQIARSLHNDLEAVTAAAHPVIGEMERSLLDAGALGACMSGSGPTVFGMFDAEAACRAAAQALHTKGWRLYAAETLTGSPYKEHLEPAP